MPVERIGCNEVRALNLLKWTRAESDRLLLHAMEIYYRCTTGPESLLIIN